MNADDDKAIYVASQQFSDALARLDAVLIYQATDRHGLFEWAAQVDLDSGWDTYLSLGIWEVEPHKILGVQGSTAQVRGRDKYVCDFSEQVSIEHEDYHLLEASIQNVLKQAVEAGRTDLSTNPDWKLPEPYAFAAPPRTMGA
jgi:hypothetical protein